MDTLYDNLWWKHSEIIPFWEDELALAFLHFKKITCDLKFNAQSIANVLTNDFTKLMNEVNCDWDT